jgi:alkylation response protein AidB-like acyl-CoA dehydrogenase
MPGIELGHRGSDHATLTFRDFEVPASAVVGGVGKGFAVAMSGLSSGRLSVAAGAVGLHRAALHAALAFTSQREQFGKPLAAFQMVQERLADMLVALHCSRGLVHRVARRRVEGTEVPADLAMAKLQATEAAAAAAEQCVLLHGARGYSSAHVPERLLRDIQGLRIYEGTSFVQKTILARALLPK